VVNRIAFNIVFPFHHGGITLGEARIAGELIDGQWVSVHVLSLMLSLLMLLIGHLMSHGSTHRVVEVDIL
jgi:hypothetical protein